MHAPPFPAAAIADARDAAKLHLRVSGTGEDAALEAHAAAALALCEAFTGRALIVRDWTGLVPATRCWQRLAAAPVTAITGVTGLGADGAGFALASDAYAIDVDANGEGWVRVTAPGAAGRAEVAYSAGMAADYSGLPAPITQGAVLLIGHFFDGRAAREAPPAAVAALWRPWRRMRLETRR